MIAVDIASKSANIEIGFLDRFSGSVVITGKVGAVESALKAVITGLVTILGFTGVEVTRT
ncbi:BMC domain-containing protein [Vagococcus sp. BWB3-3]|uniref:BMC domain-containing protein n=1 Tax=Vagococcus allomyrinae TaxID=2794353 RepID=A0A940P3I0_9ENTE|nr:BMC domain-containing protein [Vagococcus allomyrinae]